MWLYRTSYFVHLFLSFWAGKPDKFAVVELLRFELLVSWAQTQFKFMVSSSNLHQKIKIPLIFRFVLLYISFIADSHLL